MALTVDVVALEGATGRIDVIDQTPFQVTVRIEVSGRGEEVHKDVGVLLPLTVALDEPLGDRRVMTVAGDAIARERNPTATSQ